MSIADSMDVTTLRAEFTRVLQEWAITEQQLADATAAIQHVRELAEGIINRYDSPKMGAEPNASMLIQRHVAIDILAALGGAK